MAKIRTIKTENDLNKALIDGYVPRISATRGWLLVSANHPTMRVSVKLSPVIRNMVSLLKNPAAPA